MSKDITDAAEAMSVEPRVLAKTVERFVSEIQSREERVNKLRKNLGMRSRKLSEEKWFLNQRKRPQTLGDVTKTIFSMWKEQGKGLDSLVQQAAENKAEQLVRKARKDRVMEVVSGDRKSLIEIANQAIKINPKLTVILANHAGDIICMSKTSDASAELKIILAKAGGTGGGSRELAQGRVELSKFLKVIKQDNG